MAPIDKSCGVRVVPSALPSDAILKRLMALHPKVIDLSLDRVAGLMRKLGDPQLKLPPVVHVAGTNGKGSLVAYLRAMAEAAGLRVHAYISPHLVRFHERIRLNGKLIEEERLQALLSDLERINGEAPITFFEITTAAAFRAFADEPADLVLLETGLGGRLDATNLVPQPALTAITPIGMDHIAFLGDTLEKIAFEKAGILKPSVPCVVGPQRAAAARVLEARAAQLQAPLLRHGHEWQVAATRDGLAWHSNTQHLRLPRPALPGPHQIENAGTAVACALQLKLPEAAIAAGMRAVEWPARLQRLTQGPLFDLLPPDAELWLDGGHNPMAGEALAAMLRQWHADPATRRRTYLVAGMLNTKEPGGFLRPLRPHIAAAATIPIPGEANSLTAEDLARIALAEGLSTWPATNAAEALRFLSGLHTAKEPARFLIAGSLYLAGQVLARNS
jgi:dihydrofolate synthase/folylpolyglutamate synthase